MKSEVQQWKADGLGAVLSLKQEIEVRDRAEAGQPLGFIAAAVGLPVGLVRQVAEFGRELEERENRNAIFLWYGERPAAPGEKCGKCRAKLTIVPCRACRMRQFIAEQQGAG